ncbi:hypothetical protein SAMN04488552_0224 [Christiangramia echinicola]|uniref:Uncharacterized protein n=2 Tax=Christiangramia echinicola TaxID=279359 RepID=A0A1H1KWD4_9FLAO|nr:hypothetical protein SAMN04488552_0224 [Christiangramia echinicola]
MKSYLKFFFFVILTLASCNKDDEKPLTPLEQLPPATQNGKMTFGCLIDGEVFLPGITGRNRLNAFYQFVRGAYTLGISSTSGENNSASIGIFAIDVDDFGPGTYNLVNEESGNFYALYLLQGGLQLETKTTEKNPGTLTITKFDKVKGIISGTFEFTVLDNDDNEIRITDGRFDLKYTN